MEANNMRAMREALEALLNLAYEVEDANSDVGAPRTSIPTKFVIATVKAALAEPPRNCDVGTEYEQFNRHDDYCKNKPDCKLCISPEAANSCIRCYVAWSQMPYKEGGTI